MMKIINSFFVPAMVLIAFFSLSSCNSSGEEPECIIDHDCDLPLVCVDGKCVEETVIDGDRECESNFDCSGRLICDKTRGVCIDPVDGDSEVDADPDIQESEVNEEEADEDGDVDNDSEISDSEVDGDTETDSEDPITVEFISPLDGKAVDGTVQIQLSITTDLEIDKVEIAPYGSSIITLTSKPWVYNWDTSSLEEKDTAELRAVVYSGEHIVVKKIYVAIDHTDPTVDLISPVNNQVFGFGEEVLLKIDAKDNIETIKVFTDGNLYQTYDSPVTNGDGYYVYKYDISEFTKGEHSLMVRVDDSTGKHNQGGAETTFVIDNEGPSLVIANVIWDAEDENSGVLYAESPLSFDFTDSSGLKSVNLLVKKNSTTLIQLDEVSDFPYVEETVNDLLSMSDEMYPVTFDITASATDNMDNSSETIEKQITIKRVKWEFDPVSLNEDFTVPSTYTQPTGAAQSQKTSNIYVTLYDELHAISKTGEPQWSCTSENYFYTTPVVAETASLPPVVMASTVNGTTYFRVDSQSNTSCVNNRPTTNLSSPSPPVVESIEAIPNGFKLTYITCANKLGDTVCFKMTLTHTETAKASTNVFSETPLWTSTIQDVAYPSPMLVPETTSLSDPYPKMTFSAQNRIMQMTQIDGSINPSEEFNAGDYINNITYVPSLPLIAAISDKTFKVYTRGLTNLNSQYTLNSNTVLCPDPVVVEEMFIDQQPISTSSGTIFIASVQCVDNSYTPLVEAWEFNYPQLSYVRWTFYPHGLAGGTPVLGEDDVLYVAGSSNYGNLYAIDVYNEDNVSAGEMEPLWKMRLNTQIHAPLLITHEGDLVIVGRDNKVRMLDIHGSAPLNAEDSWPMFQGAPDRRGTHYPN